MPNIRIKSLLELSLEKSFEQFLIKLDNKESDISDDLYALRLMARFCNTRSMLSKLLHENLDAIGPLFFDISQECVLCIMDLYPMRDKIKIFTNSILYRRDPAVVKYIAEYISDAKPALHYAVETLKSFDDMEYFIQSTNPDLEEVGNLDFTALFIAIQSKKPEVVRSLLKAGANANASHVAFATPLHCAVLFDQKAIIVSLLKHGANPNNKAGHMCTALRSINKINVDDRGEVQSMLQKAMMKRVRCNMQKSPLVNEGFLQFQ